MPEEWTGKERRMARAVCPLHNNIEEKLDDIIERQIAQAETVIHIKSVVENGLKSAVVDLVKEVKRITERVNVIDEFAWFREWVTQLRNNLFKNSLKLAAVGGIIYFVIHFGDKLLTRAIG